MTLLRILGHWSISTWQILHVAQTTRAWKTLSTSLQTCFLRVIKFLCCRGTEQRWWFLNFIFKNCLKQITFIFKVAIWKLKYTWPPRAFILPPPSLHTQSVVSWPLTCHCLTNVLGENIWPVLTNQRRVWAVLTNQSPGAWCWQQWGCIIVTPDPRCHVTLCHVSRGACHNTVTRVSHKVQPLLHYVNNILHQKIRL